jgi:hypothetical protein
LITKTRCETLHPWAAYALMSVSASQIEFRTLERALPYSRRTSNMTTYNAENERVKRRCSPRCFRRSSKG